MCGIMGYNGAKACTSFIYEGLQKLEYRGYDSSGIAVLNEGHISVIKAKGKLAELKPQLNQLPENGKIGIGHTRWATHGAPSDKNAHPHTGDDVAIIHNGILENYKELKIEMLEKGYHFLSDTDSEVIVHLLQDQLAQSISIEKAILNLTKRIEGAYALAIVAKDEPDTIFLVKQGSPIVIGLGKEENYFASDILPLLKYTKDFVFLEDGDIAKINKNSVTYCDFEGTQIKRDAVVIDAEDSNSEKSGFRHFMLKEIHEQPHVISKTLQRILHLDSNTINFSQLHLDQLDLDRVQKIHITACGTAFYSGLIGKYILEPMLKIPVDVELASEFRYREPFLNENTLVIAMTQSGETIDTLFSVKHAKKMGCQVYSICNVPFSSISRESDATLLMNCGPEVGVASTKAFTSMVLNLYLFAMAMAVKLNKATYQKIDPIIESLKLLPNLMDQAINSEGKISELTHDYFEESHCLFIGRGINYPLALEGALKLKEISYIHAEGYAAGELKHGPIALIDKNMTVVAIAPKGSAQYDKLISNMEEINAREGKLIGIGDPTDDELIRLCKTIIPCPTVKDPVLQGLVASVPLQIFSYYMAVHRGTDVDQPRNLAKSVTVE